MTGVLPLGAQVRTRVGRSLSPVSSLKTVNRPSRLAGSYTEKPGSPGFCTEKPGSPGIGQMWVWLRT